jgi:predicted AlkP superfamily pyrophosphatase or phosphodiesterase
MLRRPRFFLPIFVLVIAIFFPVRGEVPDGWRANGTRSVILISVDGLRPDAITKHGPKDTPNFFRLRTEGAFTDNARTAVDFTNTLPNHTCMITGRLVSGDAGHNWELNKDPPIGMTLHRNKRAYLAGVFDVAHDHGLTTAFFASKKKFLLYDWSYDERFGAPDVTGEDNGRDKIDVFEIKTRSESVVDKLERTMKRSVFDFLMLHLRDPDTAGHAFEWTTRKPSIYMISVRRVDEMLGDVFETIEQNPGWRDRTYIVLTADHGGLTSAREHDVREERENFTVPFYVWGPGVKQGGDLYEMNAETRRDPGIENPVFSDDGGQPIRNADAGNLVLDLLGLPPIPGSTVNAKQDLKWQAE